MVELLAPARDKKAVTAAINNNADSIYVGITDYNMRANVANIELEDIKEITKQCHDDNKKLYVCTNTILTEDKLNRFKDQIIKLEEYNVDALILSDLGALNIAKTGSIPIHMSIQTNTSNSEALKLLKEQGVTRAVLSRELSLEQIKQIKKNSPIEIETFIHGAMCVAISGRCFLSSYFYDRNANCGECLQPCRQEWTINGTDNKKLILTQPEDNSIEKSRLLSPRDLCMIENIPDLIDAKIDAFKIEGRARPADYVATVTSVYNEAIKLYNQGNWNDKSNDLMPLWIEKLKSVFNRGFDTGFYYRVPKKTSYDNKATYKKEDIGQVTNFYKKINVAEIKLWSDLFVGDKIIIQGNKTGSIDETIKSIQIDGKDVNHASNESVGVKIEGITREGDHVYKKIPRTSE